MSINLHFANGALGTFLLSDTGASSKSWEQTAPENPAYAADPDEDCYTLIGARGSIGIPTMRVKRYDEAGKCSWFTPFATCRVEFERRDPLAVQIEHFIEVIRGGTKPLVTARDGLANLRVVDAIVEAAKTGGVVDTRLQDGASS